MVIDVSRVPASRELHTLLKNELDFPDFYGMNWHAFWDAITGLVQIPSEITFVGWNQLTQKLPEDAEYLRKMMTKYADIEANFVVKYR